jgi:glucose/arabinose dehydrogenase
MNPLLRCCSIVALVIGCSGTAWAEIRVETVASGLAHPWSLAFLPDGSMLVTERNGGLRVIRDGKLVDEPVENVPDAYVAGQGGLFDVLPDPNFAANRRIFLSYAYGDSEANATRVIRARYDGERLGEIEVVFTASPMKDTPHHYGGRMAFLPDGTLLVTVGDGFDYREQAQRLDNHLGKVVRIAKDGNAPADNPFRDVPGAMPEIYTYGHRNAQGIVVVPGSDAIWLHEHGPRGGDELNRLERGRNYGWPVITYGRDYSGARISPYTEYEGMEQPVLGWTPSIAPAGMAYYGASRCAGWQGDLFVAALAERSVRRIDLAGGRVTGQERLFDGLDARFRDVVVGPEGALYLLTDSPSGEVLRVLCN